MLNTYMLFHYSAYIVLISKGFLNFIERKWVRYYCRIEHEANSTVWNGDEDVLDLRILFGEKKYEPEDWNW